MYRVKRKLKGGFSLIEVLVVMGIIAILTTLAVVAVNPGRQFAEARDTERSAGILAILNAIGDRTADHDGLFEEDCPEGEIPTSIATISSDGYDIAACLVPDYLPMIPVDPRIGSYESLTDYDTGFTIIRNAATRRIIINAPAREHAETIQVIR